MKITEKEVLHVAKLARLDIRDEDLETFAKEFEHIMEHFHNLAEVTLPEVDLNDFAGKKSVMRPDQVTPFTDHKALFRNAKAMKDGYLEVPKVVD